MEDRHIRYQSRIKNGIIAAHVLAAAVLGSPLTHRETRQNAQVTTLETAQITEVIINPCPAPIFREPRIEEDQMPLYIDDLLIRQDLQPSQENQIHAQTRIERRRMAEADLLIFRETVLFAAGTELNCQTNMPQFKDEFTIRKLRTYARNVEVFSGLGDNETVATYESTLKAKEDMLRAIKNERTATTAIFSMHGNPNVVVFGDVPLPGPQQLTVPVMLTPQELANAYAARYANREVRGGTRHNPDVLILESCGSGAFGRTFLEELEKIQRERNQLHPQAHSRLRFPIMITAGTQEELAYIRQLLSILLKNGRLGDLYLYENFLGTERQYSDPEIYVPDQQTGEPIKIGSLGNENGLG